MSSAPIHSAASHGNTPATNPVGGVRPSSRTHSCTAHTNTSERRQSSSAGNGHAFSNNPYGQPTLVDDDEATAPTAYLTPAQTLQSTGAGSTNSLNEPNPDDSAEITSLFTTFDPSTVPSQQARPHHLGGSAARVGSRGSLNRSGSLGAGMTHSPYAPVTEEGLRARQFQQQQQQQQQQQPHQQSMHHSQEFHYASYGAVPTPLNASTFDYGGGVSGYSRFNNSTSQADMNPLAFNFDHGDPVARTPLSAGNSSTDVATLVDVYENDTITVSVKQRAGPSQRTGSRSNSLNGSSVAIQQMIEAAEKAPVTHMHMKSPASSFHAGGHQHFVPSANTLQQSSSIPTLQSPPTHADGPHLLAPAQPHNATHLQPYTPPPPGLAGAYTAPSGPAMYVDPRQTAPAGYTAAQPAPSGPLPRPAHAGGTALPTTTGGGGYQRFATHPAEAPFAPAAGGSVPQSAGRGRGAKAGRERGRGGGGGGGGGGAGGGAEPTGARAFAAPVTGGAHKSPAPAHASSAAEVKAESVPSDPARRGSVAKQSAIAEHADRSLPVRGFVVVKGKYDGHRYATTMRADQLPPFGTYVIVEGDRGEDMGILSHFVTVPEMIADCLALHRLHQAEARRRTAKEGSHPNGRDKGKGSGEDDGEEDTAKGDTARPRAAMPDIDVDNITVATDEAGQQAQVRSIVFTCKNWPYYLRPATGPETDTLPALRVEETTAFETAQPVVTHFVTIAFQQQQHRQSRQPKEDPDGATEDAAGEEAGAGSEAHRPAPADPAEVKLVDCEYQLDRKKLTLFVVRPSREVFVDFRRMQRKLFRAFHCRIWFVYMDEVSDDSDAATAVAHQLQRPSGER